MKVSLLIFLSFLSTIFFISFYASKKRDVNENNYFIDRTLNWFLIAFSAGTTANTGFIVTGAVGMGYNLGLSALLLPISWFLGDFLFWHFFPQKINKISLDNNIITISDFLTYDFNKGRLLVRFICGTVLVLATLTYTITQWTASSIAFTGFYNIPSWQGVLITGVLVTIYCISGGFKSSVRVDVIQGIFMILLTIISLYLCINRIDNILYKLNILSMIFSKNFALTSSLYFIIGWLSASLGFSLSQPHIIDKYFAGKDGLEIKKARWTYLIFVQFTWTGMTFLGILIKIIIPNLPENMHETALIIFIKQYSNQLLEGIIICGIFATISSSAGSLIIAASNYIKNDILSLLSTAVNIPNRSLLLLVSATTISIALFLQKKSVFDLAIFAIFLSGTIAPAMIIKILKLKNNVYSLCACLFCAIITTLCWKFLGYDLIINQTIVGIICGLTMNYVVYRSTSYQ